MIHISDQTRDELDMIEVRRQEVLTALTGARLELRTLVEAARSELRTGFELVRGQSSVIDRDSIEQSIAEANSQALEDGHTEKMYPPLTLLDIMTALVWGGSSAADPVIDNIHHTMLQNILLDDPWPELTREAVILLIGKRKKADRLGFYNIQWHHGHNEPFKAGMPLTYSDGEPLPPLTLAEKLLATRHREWLTAGSSRRHGPKTVFPPKPVDGGRPNAAS